MECHFCHFPEKKSSILRVLTLAFFKTFATLEMLHFSTKICFNTDISKRYQNFQLLWITNVLGC